MSTQVILEFPSDLPEEGLHDAEVMKKGKQTIVMELLRKGVISQGRAVELLEIDRHTLFDLMGEYHISVIEMTDEELKSHMHWKNFSNLKNDRGLEHPPMRGWLAMPVQRINGEFIGVLQLSDRIEDDFTEKDQKTLTPFCRVAGLAFELYYINGELQTSNENLERFNRLAIGREDRMIELKREVNTLSGKLGCPLPYQV